MSVDNVYKLGPSIPVSISRLREGCMWCGKSLEHVEWFTIIGFTEYAHGPLPSDCPEDDTVSAQRPTRPLPPPEHPPAAGIPTMHLLEGPPSHQDGWPLRFRLWRWRK